MSKCRECGEEFPPPGQYPAIRTQGLRYCPNCLTREEWDLGEGQKPVGYEVDIDRINDKGVDDDVQE